MSLKFGVGLPNCREGTAYPVPYMAPSEFMPFAQRVEELGYYSLWSNDHFTTPRLIQATQEKPPNFYEPLITYSSLANVVKQLRFVVSVIVLPHREPVLLAKQVATLDRISEGRVLLGVGIGGHREEFESVFPERRGSNRGRMLDEGIQSLRLLFNERVASFSGKYVQFNEVELAPKPQQQPFPIYISGRGPAGLRRVAQMGDGWISAAVTPDSLISVRETINASAQEAGRDPKSIDMNVQIWLSLGRNQDEAETKLKRTQHFRRLVAKHPDHSEGAVLAQYRASNLLGSPDEVIEQIRRYERVGVSHMGIVFLGTSTDELWSDLEQFATYIMPSFAG